MKLLAVRSAALAVISFGLFASHEAMARSVSNKNASVMDYMAIWSKINPNVFTNQSILKTLARSVFCDQWRGAKDEFERQDKLDDLSTRITSAGADAPDTLADIEIVYPLGEYDFQRGGFAVKAESKEIRRLNLSSMYCWPEQTTLFFVPENIWFEYQDRQLPEILPLPRDRAKELIQNGRPRYRVKFDLRVTGARTTSGGREPPYLALKGDLKNLKVELIDSTNQTIENIITPAEPSASQLGSHSSVENSVSVDLCKSENVKPLFLATNEATTKTSQFLEAKKELDACRQGPVTEKLFEKLIERLEACKGKLVVPGTALPQAKSVLDVTKEFIQECKRRGIATDSTTKFVPEGKVDGKGPLQDGSTNQKFGFWWLIPNATKATGQEPKVNAIIQGSTNPPSDNVFTGKIMILCLNNGYTVGFGLARPIKGSNVFIAGGDPIPLSGKINGNTFVVARRDSNFLVREMVKFEKQTKSSPDALFSITHDELRVGANFVLSGLSDGLRSLSSKCKV